MMFLSYSVSGRQDCGKQPLYHLLSKPLLRLMEWIKAHELAVECALKTGTQQQCRHGQSRKMLPEASKMLLLLKVGSKAFKNVMWTHTQWLGRGTKLCQEFFVSQE